MSARAVAAGGKSKLLVQMSFHVMSLPSSIVMIWIGSLYISEDKTRTCLFLMLCGSTWLSLSLLQFITDAILCKMSCYEMVAETKCYLGFFYPIRLLMAFWGSIEIFGHFQLWNSEDPTSEYYCPSLPFYYGFVTLVSLWLFLSTFVCFVLFNKKKSK